MDRTSKNPRNERFSKKHTFEMLPIKKEVAINEYKYIDDDGVVKSEIRHEIVDTREILSKVHPKTTKIEYMQQYGTLQDNEIVKYQFASPYHDLNEEEIVKYVTDICQNEIIENIENQKNE